MHGGAEGRVSTNACLVQAAGGISDSLVCQRVAADAGTGIGFKSAVGVSQRN